MATPRRMSQSKTWAWRATAANLWPQTLQFGAPLVPVRDVRAHLDVIAGGPQLAVVGAAAHLMAENGIDMAANLQNSARRAV